MKTPKDPPHVVIRNVPGGYELECLHCKATYRPALPIAVNQFVALTRSFGDDHDDCPKPEVP